MFTNFKFDPIAISQAAVSAAQSLAQKDPGAHPAKFAAGVIAARLRKAPGTYLRYGPYWWALKAAMRAAGEDFGRTDDAALRAEYGAGMPAYAAMVAAEQFREHYLATWLDGTADFDLAEGPGGHYILFDPDMEVRRTGGNPARVLANMAAIPDEPDAVLLDSASAVEATIPGAPHAIKFPLDGALWTAHVYGESKEAAESRLNAMLDGGQIGRAVDAVRGIGVTEPVLAGDSYGRPILVDAAARVVLDVESAGILS